MRQAVPPIMKASQISHIKRFWFLLLGSLVLVALAAPALAEQVSREQEIVNLRLGQRILVDDGSCPAGQINEVSGAQMTAAGIVRVRKCIPRLGTKKR
jgi:hypothetical protein